MSSIPTSLDKVVSNERAFASYQLPFVNERAQARNPAFDDRASVLIQVGLLGVCLAVITAVAAFDVYWSFKTQDVLHETEQNPLGMMLIQMDGGDIALFMTCKMLGTMFVVMAIPVMYMFRKDWGMASGISLAVYQALVFLYLNFGHIVC